MGCLGITFRDLQCKVGKCGLERIHTVDLSSSENIADFYVLSTYSKHPTSVYHGIRLFTIR